jgi:hypothetical protein
MCVAKTSLRLLMRLVILASILPQKGLSKDTASADEVSADEVSRSGESLSFIDEQDGMLDLSDYLENPAAFLLVPVPITEPSVGYGLGLGAVFLQPRHEAGREGWKRPNISGVAGMKTENGTKAVGGLDSRYWGDGAFKTNIVGVSSSINLDFYAPGTASSGMNSLGYNLEANGGQVAGEWMFPAHKTSVELNYSYFNMKARVTGNANASPFLPDSRESQFSGIGLAFKYDSRDNLFSPQKGYYSKTSVSANDEALGASHDFQKLGQVLVGYWPLGDEWTAGLKLEGQSIFGHYPFYAKPFVHLRGIPAMRYQGEQVLFSELEIQYAINERFRILGFAGTGYAWDSFGSIDSEQSSVSGGVGFRYRIARKFGLDMGLDIAVSETDEAIYIQFGSAWMRM